MGYGVWLFVGLVFGVPGSWAGITSPPGPALSGPVGRLEQLRHPVRAIAVLAGGGIFVLGYVIYGLMAIFLVIIQNALDHRHFADHQLARLPLSRPSPGTGEGNRPGSAGPLPCLSRIRCCADDGECPQPATRLDPLPRRRPPSPWHCSAGLAVKDSTGIGTFG